MHVKDCLSLLLGAGTAFTLFGFLVEGLVPISINQAASAPFPPFMRTYMPMVSMYNCLPLQRSEF